MDTVESSPAGPSELSELRNQCESLRKLLGTLLVLVIVISGTFNIFLWRQFRTTRAELRTLRPQISQMVAEYERVSAPAITNFVKQLNDFERTHPDFTPILTKYHIKYSAPTSAVPATSAPAAKK